MFSLFSAKISSVFTLAFQGFVKAVGFVVETVSHVIDTLLDTVNLITSPITEQLTKLPVIGDSIDAVLHLESNLVNNLTGGLSTVANDLAKGDLLGGISTALNGVTSTVADTIVDTVNIVEGIIGLTTPITGLISELPLLGGILDAAGQTTSNLLGLVEETGQYVGSINPVDLVGSLISDPTSTLGGVVSDAAATIDNLLNDLLPVTDLVSEIPVIGGLIDQVGQSAHTINQGIYDLSTQISQIDLLAGLNNTPFYI